MRGQDEAFTEFALGHAGARTYMNTSSGHFTSGDGLQWRRLPWKAPGFTSADSAD